MIEVQGKFNSAKIFTEIVDEVTIAQVIEMCNQKSFSNGQIRIMPDCHAGKGSVVGTTIQVGESVVPNVVGVDIGCGMLTTKLMNIKKVDFDKLDKVIRNHVPHGFNVNSKEHSYIKNVPIDSMKCLDQLKNRQRINLSLSSLGGGNHFIELNEDENGNFYLVIHSGSRNLGKQVAELYQEEAIASLFTSKEEIQNAINSLKAEGRFQEIASTISNLKGRKTEQVPNELAFLKGQSRNYYLNDMNIAQIFASYNRKAMAETIFRHMEWEVEDQFETIHNYIDVDKNMLRKGAVSAEKGEKILIPMNMRDGSIIAVGKGNEDWNHSAPHGAGRLMSRKKAKENIDFVDFEEAMKNVWSTSVTENTIDESPFAYKPMEQIINAIKPTAEIVKYLKPVYNFKSS
ncbi:RtcB family protein [Gottfriedia luciferensis]|uniref:RtcB family protein n=1 Tax=Gottfriedia luciferensis TaxID=178774 RepID=UPI000B437523|nr:RtcB family protein [Gottfriedia luciferensis]